MAAAKVFPGPWRYRTSSSQVCESHLSTCRGHRRLRGNAWALTSTQRADSCADPRLLPRPGPRGPAPRAAASRGRRLRVCSRQHVLAGVWRKPKLLAQTRSVSPPLEPLAFKYFRVSLGHSWRGPKRRGGGQGMGCPSRWVIRLVTPSGRPVSRRSLIVIVWQVGASRQHVRTVAHAPGQVSRAAVRQHVFGHEVTTVVRLSGFSLVRSSGHSWCGPSWRRPGHGSFIK